MDKQISSVLSGQLSELPPVHSQIVRVFTSSTFTDTQVERNYLIKTIYPALKEHCRNKYGLDFQVVDMRWGVRDDATDDHITSALCLQEIRNCQNISVGPSFVTFLCQRYGHRPIPALIECDEFERMINFFSDNDEKKQLLNIWYRKDTNATPPTYVLQKISSIIPGFISDNEDERNTARKEWQLVYENLKSALRNAANSVLNKEHQQKYFMSVTEDEIRTGILEAKDTANNRCLGFIRIIKDIDEHIDHPKAWRFIDMTKDQIDTDAQKHLIDLRDETLPKSLETKNLFRTELQWSADEGGIGTKKHEEYLREFGNKFYQNIVRQIDNAIQHRDQLGQNELFLEVLQHLKLAKDRCDIFHGRDELLYKIQSLIQKNTRQPIVVHGQSGCGKTSVMAMVTREIRNWLPNGKKAAVIVRFLGTTPLSSGVISLLNSICQQIALLINVTYTEHDVLSDLVQEFSNLLQSAASKGPIVIVLDSLDQLSPNHYAHKLTWLPWKVPENVHIIVSTLPEMYTLLTTLRKHVDDGNLVRVQSLGDKLGATVLFAWLKQIGRTLTSEQSEYVTETLKKCSLPLYTRLLYENVSLWKSYHDVISVPHSIRGIINVLFDRLEKAHGYVFVRHALGYITASKGGLSEIELEDVLSLDDEVLNEVFQYHVPPVRRIPQLLIVRLRQDIAHYIVNREADGVMVMYWYHRQFIEAAYERFIERDDKEKALHSILAEYYLGTWHNKGKPFSYTASQAKKLGLKSTKSLEDRRVPAQPETFKTENVVRFNRRKLNNLPHHLDYAVMNEKLIEQCLLNYQWLFAKIRAFSLRETLSDFELNHNSLICKRLMQSLSLSRSTLTRHPTTLACEILARLNIPKHSDKEKVLVAKLVQDAVIEGSKENALVPCQQSFDDIDERLKYELEHPHLSTKRKIAFLSQDGKTLHALVKPNILITWDLEAGEIERQTQLWPNGDPDLNVLKLVHERNLDKGSSVLFTPKFAIFASSQQQSQNPVVVFDINSYDIKYKIGLKKFYPKIMFEDQIQLGYHNGQIWMNAAGTECAVHDLKTGESVHVFESKPSLMLASDTGVVLFYIKQSNTIEAYSMTTRLSMSKVFLSNSVPEKILTSFDGTYILNKNKSSVTLWDFESTALSNRELITNDFGGKTTGKIFDMEISSDFNLMALSHKDGILIWNLKFNKLVKTCNIPQECIPEYHRVLDYKVAFTANAQYIAAAFEGFVILWSTKHKSEKVFYIRASNDTNRILNVMSSENEAFDILVAIKEKARMFKILDVKSIISRADERKNVELKMGSGVRYLSTAQLNGTTVCRTYNSNEVAIFDSTTGKILRRDFQNREVMQPSISRDGRFVILNTYNPEQSERFFGRNLCVYSTKTGKCSTALPVNSLHLRTYNISHSGDLILTHSEESIHKDVEIALWKSASGEPEKVQTLDCNVGGISTLECICDDRYVVTLHNYSQLDMTGEACDMCLFDVSSGSQIHKSSGYVRDSLQTVLDQSFFFVAKLLSPNNNTICVFNTETMVITPKGIHQTGKMYIDANGKRGVDTAIQVFDLAQGRKLAFFGEEDKSQMRQNPQTYPKISPDGKFVAWFSLAEGRVNVGCVDTNTIIGTAFVHSTPLSLRFCYKNIVAVGCEEGYIMLYNVVQGSKHGEIACKEYLERINNLNINGTHSKTTRKNKNSTSVCNLL